VGLFYVMRFLGRKFRSLSKVSTFEILVKRRSVPQIRGQIG